MNRLLTLSAVLFLAELGAACPATSAQTPSPAASGTSQGSALTADQETIRHMQAQLQDWANLKRYAAENAALPASGSDSGSDSNPKVRRVVFMGDSITDGWGRAPGTGPFFPGKPYINRGISGQTTPQMLVRFYPDVVRLHPAVVVILAGTNDIAGNTGPETPETIKGNLAAMADIAKSNGIRVVLASITPAYIYPWKPEVRPTDEIRDLNAWMKTYCSTHGCVYLNYFDAMADPKGAMLPGLSSDGVHPLAKGYAIMAPLAEHAISQAESR